MGINKCKYIISLGLGLFFLQAYIFAQKTYTFKVRTPKTTCTITVRDTTLWIDKDNTINVTVTNAKGKIKVNFLNGTVIKKTNDDYVVTFDNGGKTVITVYQYTKGNFRLVHSESIKVEEPVVYFCGVKVDSKSKGFQMDTEHFKAKSIPFNKSLKINGFDMIYFDGITDNVFHSDTTMLSKKMTDIIFEKPQNKGDQSFRFGMGKRVYLYKHSSCNARWKEKIFNTFRDLSFPG